MLRSFPERKLEYGLVCFIGDAYGPAGPNPALELHARRSRANRPASAPRKDQGVPTRVSLNGWQLVMLKEISCHLRCLAPVTRDWAKTLSYQSYNLFEAGPGWPQP